MAIISHLTIKELQKKIVSQDRVCLSDISLGALSYFLANADIGPSLIITPQTSQAREFGDDLEFFLKKDKDQIFVYPSWDHSPFVDIRSDQKRTMDRLGLLTHISLDLPWKFIISSGPSLIRHIPPISEIKKLSHIIETESELHRDECIASLEDSGYIRMPIVEDPGTYAIRGSVIDIFIPHYEQPIRIELDDWLILSIKHFDPSTQRSLQELQSIVVHPVQTIPSSKTKEQASIRRLRALYDRFHIPTTKTIQWIKDIQDNRFFVDLDSFLPAFYPNATTLFDYLTKSTRTIIIHPTQVSQEIEQEYAKAKEDRNAKIQRSSLAFDIQDFYSDKNLFSQHTQTRPSIWIYQDIDSVKSNEDNNTNETAYYVGAKDQQELASALTIQRKLPNEHTLAPLAKHALSWLENGFNVSLVVRTNSQMQRLKSMLYSHELPLDDSMMDTSNHHFKDQAIKIMVGNLQHGFLWSTQKISFVSEREIFGKNSRIKKRKIPDQVLDAFVDDLRQLQIGDHVVHQKHGIGIYKGLEKKCVMLSAMQRMHGKKAPSIDVLIIEYQKGDKLFLPLTSLNMLQKFSGQGAAKPRIDKLGGISFAKKKSKVQKHLQHIADELLQLYAKRQEATCSRSEPVGDIYTEFEASFPFEETPDQAKAIEEVLQDLEKPKPMDRLICGDVGFGKTEVAMRGAFYSAMQGKQVAILCPTTVLAQQHYISFSQRMQHYPVEIRLLSRFVPREEVIQTLRDTKIGKVDILIGTHRILSKDVHFKNIGLLIVDEEQRFGLSHKERIKQLKTNIDVLTLSATPIPRTLNLAIGGLRDLSLIKTAPVDRRSVRTFSCQWDDHILRQAIIQELKRNGQVFFVYKKIEGLYERAQKIQSLVPEAKVAVAHGQLNETTLEKTMIEFVNGYYDILCSTTIIESGLDIPRANTIIIDSADHFGLTQLYQLRGRIGRSEKRGYCYLLIPVPSAMSEEARTKIEAIERFTQLGSGFHIASLDMELRGSGSLLGAQQSGHVALVGHELFLSLLQETVANIRGENKLQKIEPDIHIDIEHYIPEEYIRDVGLRLSLYKRLASAPDEESIQALAEDMNDRFGEPPLPTKELIRVMMLKPKLRYYRVLGCQANAKKVILHLRDDTPLDSQKVIQFVQDKKNLSTLSRDMKLCKRFEDDKKTDAADRVIELLLELKPLKKNARIDEKI